jgi:nitroreductase
VDLDQVLRRRAMVRGYDPNRPVPPELLARALRRAVRAPSAGFSQGWDFLVLTDTTDRRLFWSLTARPGPADAWLRGMRRAPALIVCLSDPNRYRSRYGRLDKPHPDQDPDQWLVPYWDLDAAMAAELILLGAVSDGLGAGLCAIPARSAAAVRTAFAIPADRNLVALLTLGYPAPAEQVGPAGPGEPRVRGRHRPTRRPLTEVTHLGRFGNPPTELLDHDSAPPDHSWAPHDADGGSAEPLQGARAGGLGLSLDQQE